MKTPVPDFPRLAFGRATALNGDVFCLHVNPAHYVTPSAMEEAVYEDGGSVAQALKAYVRFLEIVEILPRRWSVVIAAPRRGTRRVISILHAAFCTKKDLDWCVDSLAVSAPGSKYLRDRFGLIRECLDYIHASGYAVPD